MIRPLLSLKRLSFSEKEGQVNYQYAKEMPEKERMDYMEFIARVTSHIPDKGQVMVRYYGLYSNAHRGKKRKKESDTTHLPFIEEETQYVPSKGWAEMIKKVYEVDPLICPKCVNRLPASLLFLMTKSVTKFVDGSKFYDVLIG